MADEPTPLDRLVAAVLASRKYATVCPELVRSLGERELGKRRSEREAVKATKDRLHQVGGAYLDRRLDYTGWLADLRRAVKAGGRDELRAVCTRIMGYHASSRERLAILEPFYATTLGGLPPIRSVLDVACGLNPLAIPWMPLAAGAEYWAYDIYQDMVGFVDQFLRLVGLRGGAMACDVLAHPPARRADLALILKTIPCLEHLDKAAGERLLDTIDASHLLISFPVHSLGGASKGMPANYEARFRELVAGRSWRIRRFAFASELAFLVSR